MQTKSNLFAFALMLTLALPCFAEPATTSDPETQAVQQANTDFYTALNAMFTGEIEPMKNIWSHDDDVTYMGPMGGIETGWDAILAVWEQQAALNLGGKVEPQNIHITYNDNLAVVQCLEEGNNLNTNGNPEHVSIRATNIFRKENGQWKMIGHHTDLLPFLQN